MKQWNAVILLLCGAAACGGGNDSTPSTPTAPTSPTAPTPPAAAPVATASLSPASATLLVAGSQQLVVTLRDAQGNVLSGRTVSWASANTVVATVGTTGVVAATAPGTATISATSEGVTATAAITVFSPTAIPVFDRPFAGEFPTANFMDHNIPLEFVDSNSFFVAYWGESHAQTGGMVDGHSGYDFAMPEGTPLFAVAAGTVVIASTSGAFFCPPLNRTVNDQANIYIEHALPGGIVVRTRYTHVSRTDVTVGQQVAAGQQVALSGNTGCSVGPHLHFEVLRRTQTRNGQQASIDPYGWTGVGQDPWDQASNGAQSIVLWKPGQAPRLWRQRSTGLPATALGRVRITTVVYEGVDDAANPNNEYVELTLETRLAASQSLDGYRLRGDKALLNVELPAGFTLTAANPTLRVYTGSGTNAPGVIYTGRLSGVWSNLRDDCARLVDPAGGQWRFDLGNGCP